jgi:tetratricopeptide (TPR) repeat protein
MIHLAEFLGLLADGIALGSLLDVDFIPTFSSGDPPDLARIYETASETIANDPSNVDAYFRRGVICQSKRWYGQAFHDFSEVLCRDPKHARAWLLLSEVLASLGQYEAAQKARQEALALDPSFAPSN